MTAQLQVAPNPAAPGSRVRVSGIGFPADKVYLTLDGQGKTTNVFGAPTFDVWLNVASTVRQQTLIAYLRSTGTELARVSIAVQKAAPPVVTPPTGTVWTAPANMTAAGFLDKIADLSVGTILLRPDHRLHTSGIEVGALPIHVDRSVKPLLIQPIDGTSTFHGVTGAAYYDGVFDWQARGITMNDVAFGDYWLAQAGIHSINGSTGLRFARHDFLPTITRHPHATKPIFPWAVYQGRGHNEDIVYDSFDVQGTGISGIQIDCESCATGGHPATAKDITVRNLTGRDLAYLFYENVATDGLTLDGATGINCGWNGVAVAFHQARGTYRGVSVAPSVVARNGSQMVAA